MAVPDRVNVVTAAGTRGAFRSTPLEVLMKRFLGVAVAMFFALVVIALSGADSSAVAGHGCHGRNRCHGRAHRCHGERERCHGRHHRRHRCHGEAAAECGACESGCGAVDGGCSGCGDAGGCAGGACGGEGVISEGVPTEAAPAAPAAT